MTLTKKDLRMWQDSTFTLLTTVQSQAILERFGAEPEPHVWSEQDIAIQISNYLAHGVFAKPMVDNSAQCRPINCSAF